MVKKWHVGCFACSVCDKVFVLKFFNYYFVDIAIYFNSKTILLHMLIAPTCRNRMGFCIARCYLRRHCCKHLSPPPAPLPPTNQPAKQFPNRQRAFYGCASLPVPSCLDMLQLIMLSFSSLFVSIIMFSHLPQPRVWSERLRLWRRHWILNEVIINLNI